MGELDEAGWADGWTEWVKPVFHLQGHGSEPLVGCMQICKGQDGLHKMA